MSTPTPTRTEAIRLALGIKSKAEMGRRLGLDASGGVRLVNGETGETGPVRLLLDHLAREAGREDLTAERWASESTEAAE